MATDLDTVRNHIFRGLVQFDEHELDDKRVWMTSTASAGGILILRAVHKPSKRAGYLALEGDRRGYFFVADSRGVLVDQVKAKGDASAKLDVLTEAEVIAAHDARLALLRARAIKADAEREARLAAGPGK